MLVLLDRACVAKSNRSNVPSEKYPALQYSALSGEQGFVLLRTWNKCWMCLLQKALVSGVMQPSRKKKLIAAWLSDSACQLHDSAACGAVVIWFQTFMSRILTPILAASAFVLWKGMLWVCYTISVVCVCSRLCLALVWKRKQLHLPAASSLRITQNSSS